jgi:hypothetical protein
MASNTSTQINSSDPAVAIQIQRETNSLLGQVTRSSATLSSAPSVNGSNNAATSVSPTTRSIAPIVSGSEVLYLQSTTSTSRDAVTINSSINNESGDITTVYSTNGQITVNPINQTINQYTSVNSGVDQIVAGNGVTISSTGVDGTGIVTINSDTTTLGNIVSINLDGNAANVLHGDGTWSADQTTYSNSNVVGLMAAFGSNTITTTGNVSVGNIIGNGQALTNIAGANVSGTVANATFATTAGSANTANSATVANSANAVAGANVSGTVANAAYADNANFANSATVAGSASSVTLANVSGAGNIASINLDGSGSNVLYGNGIFAPAAGGNTANANYANFAGTAYSVDGANVSGAVANATFALDAGNANIAYSVAAGNVSGLGNIATINLDGNVSNLLTGNGTYVAIPVVPTVGNIATINLDGNSQTWLAGNGVFANIDIPTVGNIATLNLDGNVSNLLTGNGTYVAIPVVPTVGNIATLNLDGSTSNVLYGNGVFAAVPAPTVSQDITSSGAMSIMLYDGNIKYNNYATVEPSSGNIAGGNISATGNVSGGNLTTGGSLSVSGTSNIGGNLTVGTGTGGNITGGNLISSNFFTGTLTTNAQPNITSLGTLTGLTVDGANITLANGAFVGNGAGLTNIAGASVSGFVPNANVANTAFAVAGANVSGTVANATYAANAGNANNATTANSANSVNIANVTGLVLNQSTIYVGKNGNDTTGNGTVINPYLTISKAVDLVGEGGVIIVYPGGYHEDVTIDNKFAITISSETPGGKQPFTPAIYGNLTISGNSSSFCFKGIGVQQRISHTSSGTVYLSEFNLGSSNVVGALSKTGSGSLAIQNCSMALVSGGNITPVTISGAGNVIFSNVALGLLSVSNTSATVSMLSDSTSLQANISAGSLNIFDSVLYTLADSGSNAIVGTGGVVNVRNSIAINPNQTTARLNIGPSTVLAYDDFYFDRPNSNVGINPNITIDFQSIRLSNTLSVTGNLTAGNISTAGIVKMGVFVTGNIPAAATAGAGAKVFVTDATANTFGTAYVGGAANAVPVWSDGTAWYIG